MGKQIFKAIDNNQNCYEKYAIYCICFNSFIIRNTLKLNLDPQFETVAF